MDKCETVLLIEDVNQKENSLLPLVREILIDNTNLDFCASLKEALAYLLTKTPELIILDVSLPNGVGLSVLLAVIKAAPTIPIIVATSLNNAELIEQSLALGVDDYLIKGKLTKDELLKAIDYAAKQGRFKKTAANFQDNLSKAAELAEKIKTS
jgi:DNA-binding NarL/FixJ family response regulator